MENKDYFTPALKWEKEEKPKDVVALPELPDTTDIKKLAQSVEGRIFRTYYDLMINEETPAAVRKACADALADRARGKPVGEQVVEETKKVEALPDDEVIKRLEFLLKGGINLMGAGNEQEKSD